MQHFNFEVHPLGTTKFTEDYKNDENTRIKLYRYPTSRKILYRTRLHILRGLYIIYFGLNSGDNYLWPKSVFCETGKTLCYNSHSPIRCWQVALCSDSNQWHIFRTQQFGWFIVNELCNISPQVVITKSTCQLLFTSAALLGLSRNTIWREPLRDDTKTDEEITWLYYNVLYTFYK